MLIGSVCCEFKQRFTTTFFDGRKLAQRWFVVSKVNIGLTMGMHRGDANAFGYVTSFMCCWLNFF